MDTRTWQGCHIYAQAAFTCHDTLLLKAQSTPRPKCGQKEQIEQHLSKFCSRQHIIQFLLKERTDTCQRLKDIL